MECCILLVTILLWLFTFVNCEKICDPLKSGKKRCCTHFKYVNGKCIECPKGSFGEDCTSQCPDGYYGVGCKGTCNCTGGQICDVQEGCVQNKTGECPVGSFGEKCSSPCSDGYYGVACKERCNCTADQICNVYEGCVHINTENTIVIIETTSTEQETTESNGNHEGILWNHLYAVPLGVVMVVLVILLVHTHRRKERAREDDSPHDQQVQEIESQAVQLNQNTVQSDYAEICEIDSTYSHTLPFSNDYNELSFSRCRRERSESDQSHYDTSKNCLLKIKESKSESKQDAGGNPYSLAKLVMDTENELQQSHAFEINEKCVYLHKGKWRRDDTGP